MNMLQAPSISKGRIWTNLKPPMNRGLGRDKNQEPKSKILKDQESKNQALSTSLTSDAANLRPTPPAPHEWK